MILSVILLVLFLLILILITFFTLCIFIPSIKNDTGYDDDPVISLKLKSTIIPEEKILPPSGKKAVVMCSCKKEFALKQPDYNKEYSCNMIKSLFGSGLDCKFACIGSGDCMKVCQQNAIVIENRTAVITKNCSGCGNCIEICPQNIIKLIPIDTKSIVKCSNYTDEQTSCSSYKKEEKVEWKAKKYFKIWAYCYKIIKQIR